MSKISIYHFHNGTGGGVLSVIKNLLRFSTNNNIENHIIHVVNEAIVPLYTIEQIEGALSQQLFYYTANNNFYHTCRQLAKLLPNNKAVLVAHDWVELGMASNLGLQNPVVHILHSDYNYYYELAQKHFNVIDAYICISPKIFHSLKARLPGKEKDIFYLNFPVPPVEPKSRYEGALRLIYFAGDLTENRKQFSVVLEIARQLANDGDDFFFTIAGGGMSAQDFSNAWPTAMKNRVNYLGFQANEAIIGMLPAHDIFLLPSLAEGLPVSLVEAMKAGVVPLVTDWDGAADELISPGITGYYFKPGAVLDYVACIKNLLFNRQLLDRLSKNCMQKANDLFDPVKNTRYFDDLYTVISAKKIMTKSPLKVYGSRLDATWIPNWLTMLIRNFLK